MGLHVESYVLIVSRGLIQMHGKCKSHPLPPCDKIAIGIECKTKFGIHKEQAINMTQLGTIPSNITTHEANLARSASILAGLYGLNNSLRVQRDASSSDPAIIAEPNFLSLQAVSPERLVVVAYLPLVSTWRGANQLWNAVQVFGTSTPPAGF